MSISYETIVSFRPLSIQKDKKHYIVEDAESGDFYEMPEVCVAAIEMMNQGMTLDQAEGNLKSRFPDEEVDIIEFVHQLLELELVAELNGEEISRKTKFRSQSGFESIPPGVGQFFFNPLTSKLYLGLLVGSLSFLVVKADLFPHYRDLFVFDLMLGNIAAWLVITLVFLLLHEFGHILAARAEELPAKVGIGHRLFLVVLETDLSQVWKLPSQKRNRLYLAGMSFDVTILFMALTAQFFTAGTPFITAILKLIVLDSFLRLIYQTGVFMKTDLYYVLENMTGCYNLMESGRTYLSKWLPFLKVEASETYPAEARFVRYYAVFYLTGVALTMFLAAYYYLPQLLFAVKEFMLPGLAAPFTSLRFWDSAVFLLQIVLILVLLLYSWTKKDR